jgi:hypothetical protein
MQRLTRYLKDIDNIFTSVTIGMASTNETRTIQPRLFIPTGPFSLVYVFRPAHLAGRNKLPATPDVSENLFVSIPSWMQ